MIDDKYLFGVLQSAQPPSRGRSVLGEGQEIFIARSNLADQPQPQVPHTIADAPFTPAIEIPHAEGSGNETGSFTARMVVVVMGVPTTSTATVSGVVS